jgi:type IV secretion system protein TrbL
LAGSWDALFILAFVASVSITFVDTLPATLTLDAGGALNVLLFGLTVLALAWFAPALASEVGQGQPHLSGADAVRTGIGAGFTTAGGVFLASRSVRAIGGLAMGAGRLGGRAIGALRGGGRSGGGASGGGAAKPRALPNYSAMQPKPRGGARP